MSDDRAPPKKVPGREERPVIKRFYTAVTAEAKGQELAVLLDGRPVRTPSKQPLLLPTPRLAEAIAAEWAAQGATIEPESMGLTRLANTALDRVRGRETEIVAEIVKYAASDLLCYRAVAPETGLIARQAAIWDPLLDWAEARLGARFVVAGGIMPVEQPAGVASAMAAALEDRDAFALCAIHNMTTLMDSAVLALACVEGRLTPEAAWAAAHVDEDFQIARWGEDAEASARRARRFLEMQASARLFQLARG
jgi:chaperone required for assembly of F1-ATPase